MQRHVRVAIPTALACTLTLASCRLGPPEVPVVTVVEGGAPGDVLATVRDAWLAAHNTGDAAQLASHFAVDGTIMPAGAPARMGRAAVEEWLRNNFATAVSELTIVSSEVRHSGDLAVEFATYEARPAGSPEGPVRRGKYVRVYQRGGSGAWEIVWDMWNADG